MFPAHAAGGSREKCRDSPRCLPLTVLMGLVGCCVALPQQSTGEHSTAAAQESQNRDSGREAGSEKGPRTLALQAFSEAEELREQGTVAALSEALERYQLALKYCREAGEVRGEAATLNNLGQTYGLLGETDTAIEYYNQAAPLVRRAGDLAGEGAVWNNIGLAYSDQGDPQKALEYYNLSLPFRRQSADRVGEARTLNNMGLAYQQLGQKTHALTAFHDALKILQTKPDNDLKAIVLKNLRAARTGGPK